MQGVEASCGNVCKQGISPSRTGRRLWQKARTSLRGEKQREWHSPICLFGPPNLSHTCARASLRALERGHGRALDALGG